MINDNRNPGFFQQPNQNQYNIILPNNNQPVIGQRQAYPMQPPTQPIVQQPLQFQQQFPLPPQVNYVPQTIQSKPNVLPTVYQEKPTQVINMDEIEAPWRLKCATLERQILELQIQLRKGPGPTEPDAIEVIDDTRLRELESKKAQLQQMIQDRDREISELENQIHQQQESIEIQIQERTVHYSNEIETWQKRFQQLERDYQQSQRQLQDLQEEQKRLEKQNQDVRTSQQRVGQSRNY
ncbi:unnamed protein product [Paramecium pentaurelia]|uniref:Uncharacterized protein n=1 Tax=Paramecium pentaurelia TaxID=43138 RepID=A0A8S1U9Y7_9CILI|nr:unnamed protein product [Paramecium pentaurelia]